MIKKVLSKAQVLMDQLYLDTDRKNILRTRNIRRIPGIVNRRGGKVSYAEWAHVTGIFQTLIYQNLQEKTGNKILDVGCGTGLLALAAEPYISEGGTYTGIDVMEQDIRFCRKHFPEQEYEFLHFDVANPTYAAVQSDELRSWPIADNSMDMVTALSVWTHLSEEHAIYYMKEVSRVLKSDGRAIISFFYLDEAYQESLAKREDKEGRYHNTNQKLWIFDKPAYDSRDWYSPQWIEYYEDAIGLTPAGMDRLISSTGLSQAEYYPGNWKEHPGVFFQDIFVFRKS